MAIEYWPAPRISTPPCRLKDSAHPYLSSLPSQLRFSALLIYATLNLATLGMSSELVINLVTRPMAIVLPNSVSPDPILVLAARTSDLATLTIQ